MFVFMLNYNIKSGLAYKIFILLNTLERNGNPGNSSLDVDKVSSAIPGPKTITDRNRNLENGI